MQVTDLINCGTLGLCLEKKKQELIDVVLTQLCSMEGPKTTWTT